MIQVPQSKTIETPKGSPKVVGKEVHSNLKTSKPNGKENVEMNEFSNELGAQLNAVETQFKPVEVSVEKLMEPPSQLVKPNGESEIVSPKVFDPSMTKEVDKLTAPKTSQVTIDPVTGVPSIQLLSANITKDLKNSELGQVALPENNQNVGEPKKDQELVTKTDKEVSLLSSLNITKDVSTPQVNSEFVSKAGVKNQTQALKYGQVQNDLPVVRAETLDAVLLKSPQTVAAVTTPVLIHSSVPQERHPAIDLTQAEVDPQLLSNEDFIAQKNIFSKKVVSNPYGLKSLPVEQKKIVPDKDVSELKITNDLKPIETSSMNSQQFILGIQAEKTIPQNVETQAPVKVFDMSKIKSSNTNEIMNQITDYVVQAKAAKEPTVNMRVNHVDLGTIDIVLSRVGVGQDAIAVNIGTHSVDGKNFFQQNSKELFTHLSTAGLNVSDLKVEVPQQTAKNDFDFGSQSGKGSQQQGSEKQFGSEQNQRRHESERRQDLWKLLNKEAA